MASKVTPQSVSGTTRNESRRGCLWTALRVGKWLGIALIVLVLLGVVYQAAAVELDKRNYPPPGQLYRVNGHMMHIYCTGEGEPTVVLQAGGLADSLWWYRVQNQLAEHNRVCAFDRPGMGWSEPTSDPRDAITLTDELHTLLQEAGVNAPYVMAGHSWGAVLTRIYAAQNPQEVEGIVLVDSAILIPKHFADETEFDAWKSTFAGQDVLFGALLRIGVFRLTASTPFVNAGYPPDVATELGALQSRNQVLETDFAEFHDEMWELTKASADAEDLDSLPMIVLWAPNSWTATDQVMQGAPAARAEISTYSSNSVTRSIEGADHGSILGNEQYARQVSDAILEVVAAAETGQPISQ